MANEFIGRRVSVGIGIETTPGTVVAPQNWMRHLSLDFQRKTKTLMNESAMGRVEKFNDSAVDQVWAEGKLEGKLSDIGIGYLLLNMFGTVVTTDNADTNPVVRDHTFDIAQLSAAPAMTFTRRDPVSSRRHTALTLDDLKLTWATGEWTKVEANVKAKSGTTSSDTPAFVDENEFTSKHIVVKLAGAPAGLGAAAAIPVKSVSLSISRGSTPYFGAGANEAVSFDTGSYEITGEMVLRYNATTYEDLWFANTKQAMSLSIKNTDVTIGASANPGLVFTGPQVRLQTFEMSNDLDNIVEQTIGFSFELSTTDGYALRAVLTNTQTAYVA